MKITCERDKLLHAFQTTASVVPSRSPKPILQNVKLEVTADGATLMGTDLEVGIRMELSGISVDAPGTVVLPVSRVGSILRESSDERLRLESDGRKTTIRGERSKFNLPSENPDEFPPVTIFAEERYHEMPARFFREIVRRTAFATDNESSRYALGGVLIELTENQITAVATDGRRLARQQGPAKAVGGHALERRDDDHPDPGHAPAGTGAGRQRRQHPTGGPRQRRAGPQRARRRSTPGWSKAAIPNGATSSRGERQ